MPAKPTDALNVCMFTNLYRPVVSGSSTQTEALARELVKRGHQVVVITAKVLGGPDYEQTESGHIYRLPAYRLPKIPIGFNYPWLSFTFTPTSRWYLKPVLSLNNEATDNLTLGFKTGIKFDF